MCHCLNQAGAYVALFRSLSTPRLAPLQFLLSLLRYLRFLLLIHWFGIKQEATEITENRCAIV